MDALKMTKPERREKMPETTAFVDDMRATFDIVAINADENGHSIRWGKRLDYGYVEEVA